MMTWNAAPRRTPIALRKAEKTQKREAKRRGRGGEGDEMG